MADCIDCTHNNHDLCQQAGGGAWDMDNDRPAVCGCWVNGHEEAR